MGLLDFWKKKESAADRAAWLQGTVRQTALAVAQSHAAATRSFKAAETPPWMDSWPTSAGAINDDLSRQLPTLRGRARAAARNDEWAIGYMLRLDDNVLGEAGMPLQMRLKRRDGSADLDTNARLEAAFADWGEDCEVSGMSWREVESLALAAGPEDGEFLYRFRTGAGKYRIQLQIFDPALLDVTLNREWGGNRVRMGVEINADARPIAYWLKAVKAGDDASAEAIGHHVRIPAGEIRHCFLRKHVTQLRGYPWLAGGASRLWMLHDFEEAAAVASSNAAKRQGFFVTPDGEAPAGIADTIVSSVLEAAKAQGKVLTPEEINALVAAAEKYTTTMPGQYDTLPNGVDFRPYESKWPDISADGYIKGQLRGWSAARGMSYVTVGNDLESVNYSSARVGIVGEREHFRGVQRIIRRWLHDTVIREIMPYLVLATPGLSSDRVPAYLKAAGFGARRWQGIDPVKEAAAADSNLKNRLTSRRRLILERGEDPDEIFAEIAEEERLYGPAGGNAPAPTEDDEDKDEAGNDVDQEDGKKSGKKNRVA